MKVVLRPEALTLGDLEDFEKTTGHNLLDVIDLIGEGQIAVLSPSDHVSLVWVFTRHDNPTYDRERARNLRPTEVEYVSPKSEG